MAPRNNSALFFQYVHLWIRVPNKLLNRAKIYCDVNCLTRLIILSTTCKVILWSVTVSVYSLVEKPWNFTSFVFDHCQMGVYLHALSYCPCWFCFKWDTLFKTVALWGVKINCKYFNHRHSPDVTKKQFLYCDTVFTVNVPNWQHPLFLRN